MFPITCNAVGDIIAIAELVLDIARALNESRGPPSEYRAFIADLYLLHIVLASISRAAQYATDSTLQAEIILEVDRCGGDVERALKRVVKFSTLAHENDAKGSPRIKLKRQWHKLEWRFVHRGSVQNIKAELAAATQRLAAYLAISNADGITDLHASITSQFNAMTADLSSSLLQHFAALSQTIESNTTILRHSHTATQRYHARGHDDIPSKMDHRKAAVVALLCLAICTGHATSQTTQNAILVLAVCILMDGMRNGNTTRTVDYTQSNSITLIDAMARQLVLPLELCETEELFHATLLNLFSRTEGGWFIEARRYSLTGTEQQSDEDADIFPSRTLRNLRAGATVIMRIVICSVDVASHRLCPVCFGINTRGSLKGSTCHNCEVSTRLQYWSGPASEGTDMTRGILLQNLLDDLDRGTFPARLSGCRTARHTGSKQSHDSGVSSTLDWPSTHEPAALAATDMTLSMDWSAQLRIFRHIDTCIALNAYALRPDSRDSCSSRDRELFAAAENGHHALVAALLDFGLCVNARSDLGYTALHHASFYGHTEVVEFLLDRGASIDAAPTGDDYTPLALSVAGNRHDTTALLLSRGAILWARRSLQAMVLYLAAQASNIAVMQILLRLGLDVNTRIMHPFDRTALHAAQISGSYPAIKFLLQHGADLNARDCFRTTPLMHISHSSDANEILDFIVTSRGITEAALLSTLLTGDLSYMLYHAAGCQNVSRRLIELTLQFGADVNVRFETNSTPLAAVCQYSPYKNQREVVRLLLSYGADPNLGDTRRGWRALHCAVRSSEGHSDIIEMLLRSGADVNARTRSGNTPLSLARSLAANPWSRCFRCDNVIRTLVSWGGVTGKVPGSWPEDSEEDPVYV